jgi:hypothetical protein
MRALKAGLVYFLLLFVLGWVLGPIRELWAVPRFGRIAALLIEAVIMLIAMIISARWVMRRFKVLRAVGSTILMGLVALAILDPPRSRVSLTGHVFAVCRNADLSRSINTRASRNDLLTLLPHAKATGAAFRTEIREANCGQTLLQ